MPILWKTQGSIGVALIDRPERRNALDAALCDELRDCLIKNPDLGAVVIGSTGDRSFCAGADLGQRSQDVGGLEPGGGDTFRPAFEALLDEIVTYPTPVIAAINGTALGAGMQLAVACDLRVVSDNAVFGIPAARLGVVISAANTQRLMRVVGSAAARDILLTARTLNIDEAERCGLVQRRASNALEAATALAVEVAALAPLSVRSNKYAIGIIESTNQLNPQAIAALKERETEAFSSEDLREGLAAFSEKRVPKFRGF